MKWVSCLCVLAAVLPCLGAPPKPSDALDRFYRSPTQETWNAVETSCSPKRSSREVACVFVRYWYLWNARNGPPATLIDPQRSEEWARREFFRAVSRLSSSHRASLTKLLVAVANQRFDDTLVAAAGELAFRIGPEYFRRIQASVESPESRKAFVAPVESVCVERFCKPGTEDTCGRLVVSMTMLSVALDEPESRRETAVDDVRSEWVKGMSADDWHVVTRAIELDCAPELRDSAVRFACALDPERGRGLVLRVKDETARRTLEGRCVEAGKR